MFNMSLLKERLQELQVNPKKALGQNFLVNENTCERIVDAVRHFSPTALVEVGPGLGALTDKLQELQLPLTLIELDRAFCKYWRERGLTLLEADALKVRWSELQLPLGAILVSNLPYQISASLVIDRSIDPCGVSGMVLMFQKEVAQRIVSKSKEENYGLLSVISQSFWECQFLLEAGPKDFYPPPSVASRVLTFRRRGLPPALEGEGAQHYLTFVKAAFSQRRKMLIKNLTSHFSSTCLPQSVENAFQELGLSLQVRAEELSPEQFLKFFSLIKRRNA